MGSKPLRIGKLLMKIREYLKENKILFDGAFGTYYATFCADGSLPEKANIASPQLVNRIHSSYIEAGANLIRTNTFASNTEALHSTLEEVKENIIQAYRLAKETVKEANKAVYIAGDIGPISFSSNVDTKEEYLALARTFMEQGADCLLFETFSEYDTILPVIEEIKLEYPEAFIMVQFSVNQYGYTNAGISIRRIFENLSKEESIDSIGLNCGVGPGHMLRIVRELNLQNGKYISVLPNASYPKIMQDRIVFLENQEYFAEKMKEIAGLGVDFVGGCCGTNPEYIRRLKSNISLVQSAKYKTQITEDNIRKKPVHAFYDDVSKKKLITVELAPPFGADDEKILDAANYLKKHQADAITFPDSPSGRTRADSILIGVKTMEKTGACAIPHICCRDKNAIAIRSQLLGAYMNGIRNLLIVTGDPIPTLLRKEIKSVYNFDSIGLMRIVQEMNENEFAKDPICYGGALNPNRLNLEVEIDRMKKKIDAGASFFMTQPIFSEQEVEKLRRITKEVPARILCGLMPLVSYKNAMFIKNEMVGIQVTDGVVNRYEKAQSREAGEQVGVELAREIMKQTTDFVAGYYFSIPFNRVYLLEQILK